MDKRLHDQLKEFLHIANALLESMNTSLLTRSDENNLWKYSGYWQYARKYNQLVQAISQVIQIETIIDLFDMKNLPTEGNTVPFQQKAFFESVHANLSILKAYLETKLNIKADEIANLTNFLQVNLRKAVFHEPEKEIDIQDAIEQLIIGRGLIKGIDYDRETGRVKVSIKEVVPDFIFPRLGLALEVKLSKDKNKSHLIVDEINADIQAYSKQYSSILFVIYDLSTIRDEVEFKQGLEIMNQVSVIVVKH
jgi:hypothetical protein